MKTKQTPMTPLLLGAMPCVLEWLCPCSQFLQLLQHCDHLHAAYWQHDFNTVKMPGNCLK